MPVTDVTTDPTTLTMTLTAELAAPVERVWAAFTDPVQLGRFWGPPTYPARFTEFDLRVGGLARYAMTGPNGEHAGGQWEFLEIDPPHSFEVRDSFADPDGNVAEDMPSMRMTFDLQPVPEGTRLVNITYFDSLEALEKVVAMGAVEGTTLALNQLDKVLQSLRDYAAGRGTQLELLSDTLVRITRLIDGPRELVWRAHHDETLLRRWLLGPDGWEMTYCVPPTDVGQEYRWGWRNVVGAGEEFGFEGTTLLVQEPFRVVTTERMTGTEGPSTINDLTFEEEDGATLLTMLITYPDKETRDSALATGMVDGMEDSYARLEATLVDA